MSRIGKKPVPLPQGVSATVEGQAVRIKGPKGELSVSLANEVEASVGDHGVMVAPRPGGAAFTARRTLLRRRRSWS